MYSLESLGVVTSLVCMLIMLISWKPYLISVFLGYALNYKDYLYLDVYTQRLYHSRHVIFNEHSFPYKNVPVFSITSFDASLWLYTIISPSWSCPLSQLDFAFSSIYTISLLNVHILYVPSSPDLSMLKEFLIVSSQSPSSFLVSS